MKIFLAGNTILPKYIASSMNWGGGINKSISCGRDTVQREEKYRGGFDNAIKQWHPFILESYYYTNVDTERLLPEYGDFLLDSGAFTFIQNNDENNNFEQYLESYAEFINKNNVEKFFELDVDSIVGYERVKQYRQKLEKLTNKQCIPVWHRQRGLKEYIKHCDEYPYVAIGGIAIKEIKKTEYPVFTKLLDLAHQRNTRVHGLGFTQLNELQKYRFDSVDSTAWLAGSRYGFLYYFDGRRVKQIKRQNFKIVNQRDAALHNYCEWIKYQKYANEYL